MLPQSGTCVAEISFQEEYVLPAWAAELGAAVAQLEHRFFGVSYPRKDENLHERYASLTLDNVLDDSVGFLQWLKESNASLAQSPVITTGGMLLNMIRRCRKPCYHPKDGRRHALQYAIFLDDPCVSQ